MVEWGLSTLVFDDPSNKRAVLDCGSEHFRDGFLLKNAFLLSFNRQTDVNGATLCCEYLHPKTIFRQIDLTRVCGVKLDGRSRTGYLDCERR